MFKAGQIVRLFGLSNEHLNGALGTIQGDLLSNGRYGVKLSNPATAVQAHPNGIVVKPSNLICIKLCGNPICGKEGERMCTRCSGELYCSPECQKLDWKTHKIMCYDEKLLTLPEVHEKVEEMKRQANAAECLSTKTYNWVFQNGEQSPYEKGMKAEMLARKAIRIYERIYGLNHYLTVPILKTLSDIQQLNFAHIEEAIGLLERILTINIERYGVDSDEVAIANNSLSNCHYNNAIKQSIWDARVGQLHVAVRYCKEAIRIYTKIYGSGHERTLICNQLLSELYGSLSL
jgi:tetratricopeptide (TPR) repeat protein